MKRIKKELIRMVGILMILFMLVPSQAFAASSHFVENGRVLRVFYPLQTGFTQKNEAGVYSGYSYEYLMKIAQLTGWKYEFIAVEATNESLQHGMDMVKNGAYDLIGAMVHSEQLAEDYAYASIPCGEMHFTLIGREDNRKLNTRTLPDYPALKIAIIESTKMQNKMLDQYCEEKGLTYTPVYAKDNKECRALMEAGQADLMIGKDVSTPIGFKTVVKIANQPFYFASSKQNTALMEAIDEAVTTISMTDPGFQSKLYEKYFTKASDYNISLTADEADYLENAPPIRVVVPSNQAPIQDYNRETGKFSGIMVDIMDVISRKSGLAFEMISAGDATQIETIMRTGAADIVAGIPYDYADPESFFESGLLLTSPVLTSPIARISNAEGTGVNEETLVDSSVKSFVGQKNILYMNDIDEIFNLVEKGEYKEAFVNGYTGQHFLELSSRKNIVMTLVPYSNYDLSLGVVRDCDLRLMGILEQTIATLDPSEIEDIVYRNTSHAQQIGLLDFIKRDPIQFVIPLFAVLIIILSLLLLLFFKTRRINKLISEEKNRYKAISQTDRLTKTYNNEAFKQLCRDYLMKDAPYGAFVICDIDDFKEINDTYGHPVGDEVLRKLGVLLMAIFRDNDVVGRIGGDEFAILVKDAADAEIIETRCRDLLLKSRAAAQECQITLSIGAVMFRENNAFEALFKKADTVLYEVKSGGKDNFKLVADSGTEQRPQ